MGRQVGRYGYGMPRRLEAGCAGVDRGRMDGGLNLCSGAWAAGLSVVEILFGALDSLPWPNAGRQQRETNGVETGSPLSTTSCTVDTENCAVYLSPRHLDPLSPRWPASRRPRCGAQGQPVIGDEMPAVMPALQGSRQAFKPGPRGPIS